MYIRHRQRISRRLNVPVSRVRLGTDTVARSKVYCSRQHRAERLARQKERLFNFSLLMICFMTGVAVMVVFSSTTPVIKTGAALALWGCYRTFYTCVLKR